MLTDPDPSPEASTDLSRRCWLGALAVVALGAVGAGCSESGPLRIGFIGGLSGRVADLGIGGRNGAQLAVDDLNAAGGLSGRKVELVPRDDEQNADTARARLKELFDAGVPFVVGPMTSAMAVALAPLADASGLPLISPTSTTHELSGKADAFFRVVSDAPTGAAQQADALLARGRRRLVTVSDLNNAAFAESWSQAAAARFKAKDAELALAVKYRSEPGVAFSALAQEIVAAKPDAVIIAASAADTALLAQQIVRLNHPVALAASPWAGTEHFPEMGGRALEGMLVAQYFDRDSTAAPYLGFVDRFRARFGEPPGYPAVNGYDALMLGVEGLRRRGQGTLLASLAAMRSHDGLQRIVLIDANGDSRSPMYLAEVKSGRYASLADR